MFYLKVLGSPSINKYIQFVQFLDVCLYFRQLLLVIFLSTLETSGVYQPYMCYFLVLTVNLVPFSFETLSDFSHFSLTETLPE